MAISKITGGATSATSGTTILVPGATGTMSVTAGDYIAIFVTMNPSSATLTFVKNAGTATITGFDFSTQQDFVDTPTGALVRISFAWARVTGTGTLQLKVTSGSTITAGTMLVEVYRGAVGFYQGGNQSGNTGSTGTDASTTVTTQFANSWVVGAAVSLVTTTNLTGGTGTTVEQISNANPGGTASDHSSALGSNETAVAAGTAVTLHFTQPNNLKWAVLALELASAWTEVGEIGLGAAATVVASSVKAASAGIQASATKIASSVKAAAAGIGAASTQSGTPTGIGAAGIGAAATNRVLTNLKAAAAGIQAAATKIASSVRAASAGLSTAATEKASSIKAASGAIGAASTEAVQTNFKTITSTINASKSLVASSLRAAAAQASTSTSFVVSQIRSASAGVNANALLLASSLRAAAASVQAAKTTLVASSIKAAAASIQSSIALIASSIKAAAAGINALSDQVPHPPSGASTSAAASIAVQATEIASSIVALTESMSAVASVRVLTNMLSVAETLNAVATEMVATNLAHVSESISAASSQRVATNLAHVSELINAVSTEVASSIKGTSAGSGASATVIASSLKAASGSIGVQSTRIASSIKAATGSLQAQASLIASSIKAAAAGINAASVQVPHPPGSASTSGAAGLSALATGRVITNLLGIAEFIQSGATEIASSIRASGGSSGAAATLKVLTNLKPAYGSIGVSAVVTGGFPMANALFQRLVGTLMPTGDTRAYTTFMTNEATDSIVWVFQAPEAATIEKLGYTVSNLTGTQPTYRISLQGVNSSGSNDGVIKGGGSPASAAFITASTGWTWRTLDNSYTCSRGEFLAIVIEYSSGIIDGTHNTLFAIAMSGINCLTNRFPYVIQVNAGTPTLIQDWPIFSFGSSSKVYGYPLSRYFPFASVFSAVSDAALGIKFTLPASWGVTYKILGVRFFGALSNVGQPSVNLRLYDTDGSTILQELVVSTNYKTMDGANGLFEWYFDETNLSSLKFGSTYRLVVNDASQASFFVDEIQTATSSDMSAYPLGQFCFETALVSGVWADDPTFRPVMEPILSDITVPLGPAVIMYEANLEGT